MATVSSSVTGLAAIADDGTDTGTLNVTSGTLASTSLAQFTGYSTINVSANAAHIISVPITILASTSATLTMVVTSTIGISFTGVDLTGSQLKVNLTASEGADTITGGPDDDTLVGGDGNDSIVGGAGNGDDLVSGGAGIDSMYGNNGNDVLVGGAGGDTFRMGTPSGNDTISDFDFSAGDLISRTSGITWSAADVNSVAVVTFSNGATVTLTGIAAASVVDGWFTT